MQPETKPFSSVRIERQRTISVGTLMSEMRTWSDHAKIEPKEFRSLTLRSGTIAFDVAFHKADQAMLFRGAFMDQRLP